MGLADFEDTSHNVKVAVRFRPPDDPSEELAELYSINGNTVTVQDPLSRGRQTHGFEFSHIFPSEAGQEDVFEVVAKPLVDHLLKGFNSCCFAYGQTGSGKTHSVFGEGSGDQRGMLARSIEYLFEKLEVLSVSKEVGMAVSFTEIYLDQIRDLGRFYAERHGVGKRGTSNITNLPSLPEASGESSSSGLRSRTRATSTMGKRRTPTGETSDRDPGDVYLNQDLEIHESAHGHVYVEDLSMIPVSNIRDVLEVANLGIKMRATYETKLNARSSRSHTVFTVCIAQRSKLEGGASKGNKIAASSVNFVDLAGSERLARSKSEGRRFQEAVVINTSLSALGKVVLALASNGRCHIPYRDSKLTRVLQNSLGGSSYTTLLTTIDPSVINYEESLNSLLFADRCKNVQNRPTLGFVADDGDDMARRTVATLVEQVTELRKTLEAGSRIMAPRSITPSAYSIAQAPLQTAPEFVGQAPSAVGTSPDLEAIYGSSNSDARFHGLTEQPAPGAPTAGGDREVVRGKQKSSAEWLRNRWNTTAPTGTGSGSGGGGGSSTSNAKGSRGQGAGKAAAASALTTSIPSNWKAKGSKELKQLSMLQHAQDRLQHDMSTTGQLQAKAKSMEEGLDNTWSEFYERDFQRRTKLKELQKTVRSMETEIASLSSYLEHLEIETQATTESKMRAQQQSALAEVKLREQEIKSFPAEVREETKHSAFAAMLEKQSEERLDSLEKTAEKIWSKCEESWGEGLEWMNKAQQQRHKDEEADVERLKQELSCLKEESEARMLILQQEMLSVSHLATQLHDYLGELRSGVAVDRARTGIQPPTWSLSQLQASFESSSQCLEAALEPLRSALNALRRQFNGPISPTASSTLPAAPAAAQAAKMTTTMHQPATPAPTMNPSNPGQDLGQTTWPRRPLSGSTNSSGGRPGSALPHRMPIYGNSTTSNNNNNNSNNNNNNNSHPTATGAVLVGTGAAASSSHAVGTAFDALGATNADLGKADQILTSEWNAEEMARQFCMMEGTSQPGDDDPEPETLALRHLGQKRLRALGLELWRSLKAGEEAKVAERSRLREEVMTELCDESRVKQIAALEKEISLYQARLKVEQGRTVHLAAATRVGPGKASTNPMCAQASPQEIDRRIRAQAARGGDGIGSCCQQR